MSIIRCNTQQLWEQQLALSRASPDRLFVVHFYGVWHDLKVNIADVASAEPGITFIEMDVDPMKVVAEEYNVRAVPTFVLFKGGIVVDSVRRMTAWVRFDGGLEENLRPKKMEELERKILKWDQ